MRWSRYRLMDRPRPPLSLSLSPYLLLLPSPLFATFNSTDPFRPLIHLRNRSTVIPLPSLSILSIRRAALERKRRCRVLTSCHLDRLRIARSVYTSRPGRGGRGRRTETRRNSWSKEAHGSCITLASRHHLYLRDTPRSQSRIVTGQGPYSRRLAPIRAATVSFLSSFLPFSPRSNGEGRFLLRSPSIDLCDPRSSIRVILVFNDDGSAGDGRVRVEIEGGAKGKI